MAGVRETIRRSFRIVTVGASTISALLWVSAGSIAATTGNFYSFVIVGILASLVGAVAVNSAKKEGMEIGKVMRIVQEIKKKN